VIRPEVAGIKPAMILSSVDFPQPDGPTTAKNSPRASVRSSGLSAEQAHGRFSAHIAAPRASRQAMDRPVDYSSQAEIQKLAAYWNKKEPVPWVRIHKLPEYVHFPHMRHVNAGVTCQTCHGQIQNMKQVYQASSLNMGWCISCHIGESNPPFRARYDCSSCHY